MRRDKKQFYRAIGWFVAGTFCMWKTWRESAIWGVYDTLEYLKGDEVINEYFASRKKSKVRFSYE